MNLEFKLKLLSLALMAFLLSGCTINPQESVPVKQGQSGDSSQPDNGTRMNSTTTPPAANTTQVKLFTLEEVAKHHTKADCWMVIQNYVLDLSGYAGHPGGDTYVPYCGKDGTEAFATKGGMGGDHSNYAYKDAERYIIGELGKPMP